MMIPAMLFALVLGSVLQALLPSFGVLAQVKVPILLGITIYYALYQPRRFMILAALLSGLLQDALGQLPLGYSALAFSVTGLLLTRFQSMVFEHAWFTHVIVGALCSGFMTLFIALMLAMKGHAFLEPVVLKTLGSMLLGAVSVHFVVIFMARMDALLGNNQVEVY